MDNELNAEYLMDVLLTCNIIVFQNTHAKGADRLIRRYISKYIMKEAKSQRDIDTLNKIRHNASPAQVVVRAFNNLS